MVTITETIHNDKPLTWQDLYTSRYAWDHPFQLTLEQGDALFAEKVIRLVPRRRMIAYGTWQGKQVVAKIFFSPKRMPKHVRKELNGVAALTQNNIPTPCLYHHGYTSDKRTYVLIFERLVDAITPDEIWRNSTDPVEIDTLLKALILELATQHVLGVVQKDLHLRNFLLRNEVLYTLDPAEIAVYPPLLSKELSMQNLAQLFSQLGVNGEVYFSDLFKYYAKKRGWLLKQNDFVQLALLIKRHNERRWQRYQRKVLRESTNCACIENFNTLSVFWRVNGGPELIDFIKNIDSAFERVPSQVFKSGNSATVISATLDGRQYVIKRYNIKNIWHFLRRCFRPTRAFTSWRLAQKLMMFGIPTAQPIAFVEKRIFGLRRQSYYIAEYVAGKHAGHFFTGDPKNEAFEKTMIEKVSALLKNIIKAEITHGDLKITNILIDSKNKPVLIDLDGASEHVSLSGIRHAWQKEIKRFLQNFNHQPTIKEAFKQELSTLSF